MATLTESRNDDVVVLRLGGGLTFEGVVPLTKRFESQTTGGLVVVDLADVPVVTTPGLSLLLAAQQRIGLTGGRLVLSGLSANVTDLLRRCRLDRVFTLAVDESAAVAMLKSPVSTENATS